MKTLLDPLKALSDRNRLRVVAVLLNTDEVCACHVSELLGVSGATASRHMELLIRSGLVDSRKDGRWVHYKLSPRFPDPIREWLAAALLKDRDIKKDLKTLKKITQCF